MRREQRCNAGTSVRRAERIRAFTLIELLVVVVLVGLIAVGVTLRLEGSTQAARLRGAGLALEQTLHLARQQAGARRQPTWIQLQPGSGRYRLALADGTARADLAWRSLDGVTFGQAALRGAGGASHKDIFTVRITPTGASLPWAVELLAGSARRVVWTDGVTGRLSRRDGITLAKLDWSADAVEERR